MIKELTRKETQGRFKVLGKTEDEYTIFQNNDKDLVAQIKKVTIPDNEFENYNGTCKVLSIEDDQILCVGPDKKKFYIDEEEYNELRERTLLNRINDVFPVWKYFAQNFGTRFGDKIITVSGDDEVEGLEYDDVMKVGYSERMIQFDISDEEIYANDGSPFESSEDDDEDEESEARVWSSIMFCHFDKNGNYVNRDYNLDIEEEYKQEATPISAIIKQIDKAIPKKSYSYADNMWFTDDFVFVFKDTSNKVQTGFSLQKEKVRKNGTYGNKGSKPIKLPKDTVKSSKDAIMERILPIVSRLGSPE